MKTGKVMTTETTMTKTTSLRLFLVQSVVLRACLFYCLFGYSIFHSTYPEFPSIIISEPVRNGMKSQPSRQEEEDERNDDDDGDDDASEPADSILGSESEGEETNEVDGLLDE